MGSARNRVELCVQWIVCCVALLAFAAGVSCAQEQGTAADESAGPPVHVASAPAPSAPAPSAPETPPAAEGPRLVFGEYRIQPGDRVYMSVWGEPSLTTEGIVMAHGQVPFPLLGDLPVAEKTVSDLTEEVRQGYLHYYRDPKVSLSVTPVVWPSVYVQGNVRSPGPVDYAPGRRLLDYIGMAGGFGANADLSNVGIVSHQSGTATKTTIDMSAVSGPDGSVPDPALKPGDTLWVGRALPVVILGAVNRPGSVEYQYGLRLSDYVGMAGGPTNRAERGSVLLKHTEPDGTSSVAEVDLGAALAQPDVPSVNPVLRPGDTVTVPELFVAGTLEWSDLLRSVAYALIRW